MVRNVYSLSLFSINMKNCCSSYLVRDNLFIKFDSIVAMIPHAFYLMLKNVNIFLPLALIMYVAILSHPTLLPILSLLITLVISIADVWLKFSYSGGI